MILTNSLDSRHTRYLMKLEEGNVVVFFENPYTITTAMEKIKQATGVKLFDLSPLSIDEAIALSKDLKTLRIK